MLKSNRPIGLHVRFTDSLLDLAEKAVRLKLDIFQCFFTSKPTGNRLTMSPDEIKKFLNLRRTHFKNVYAHASYWINLANDQCNGKRALQYELEVAKRLEFTHVVLHPGATRGDAADRLSGIEVLAHNLNDLLRHEHDVTLLLENTAHGNFSIGGDVQDFALLLEKIEQPEKIAFCLDTAHAYSFGYNVATQVEQESFLVDVQKMLGQEKIQLLHLNDTLEACGSKVDKHAVVGAGNIGMAALRSFVMHPLVAHVPIIMELPVIPEEEEIILLEEVRNW